MGGCRHQRGGHSEPKVSRDLRVAEVKELDLKIEKGKVAAYRARLELSFKYEGVRSRETLKTGLELVLSYES